MEGYVYIMTNAAMPGLLKIGCTARSPEIRRRELSRPSGVPGDFEISYEMYSPNMKLLEIKIHTELSAYRVNNKKEFFKYNLYKAIDMIHLLGIEVAMDCLYKLSGVNESLESYESIEILSAIKEKYKNWVPADIISVRMYQTKLRFYLEITKENFICQYDDKPIPLIDQNIHRIDLGFIAGKHHFFYDDDMFSPAESVAKNARLFIEDFDLVGIANCCPELLIDEAYENMYVKS